MFDGMTTEGEEGGHEQCMGCSAAVVLPRTSTVARRWYYSMWSTVARRWYCSARRCNGGGDQRRWWRQEEAVA
jgi:hypothetical protein